MREHSSYLINVNFLPLPFKSSIILEGTAVSCRMEAEEACFLLDDSHMPSAQITGPFLTWFL